jgi:hypothetical protein
MCCEDVKVSRSGALSNWLAARLPAKDDTPATTCVIFTVPQKRLAEMDVATGPCVPLPGRKRALRGVHSQEGRETPEQMRAFFVVLGGPQSGRETALELIATNGPGSLYRCSDEFVALMRTVNEESIRLSDLDKSHGDEELTLFTTHERELDAAWMEVGKWHKAQVSTWNKLYRKAWAREAQEKQQSIYCWYGPPIPEYVVVAGSGPYPGKIR